MGRMATDARAPAPGDTVDRILVAASSLFATRGFHGTSTRDIAAAVGIRQPSLYAHFESKQAILAKLLDLDLGPALSRAAWARALDEPAAVRLHAFLSEDARGFLSLRYDARGLYDDDALTDPTLVPQARRRRRLHRLTSGLVAEGIRGGEFVATDPDFVQGAITGLFLEAGRKHAASPTADVDEIADEIADFVLRALLVRPAQLRRVRSRSVLVRRGRSPR
jgi:AcrR family transcriptional regulator